MNILREVRRVKKRSVPARISLLLIFLVILIINTYAWFSIQKDVNLTGLTGEVTPWIVSYYINEDENEYLDQTVEFTIDELYPGMAQRDDLVRIYNLTTTSTKVEYKLMSVKVFGQEVYVDGSQTNELQITKEGNTTTIFSADTNYPFNVSFTYDRDYLKGEYKGGDESTSESASTFRFNVSWPYEGTGTADENLAKDILDTQFGKEAYEYYQDTANDQTKAVEIKVKITSSMIHPRDENQTNQRFLM